MRKNFGAKPVIYPQPVLIIGIYDANGVPDAMNAAWGGISEETEISIYLSPEHKTVENILARKAFTVSMATADQVAACDYVGIVSGNDVPDKVARAGVHAVKSELVDAPLFEELPMAVECRLISYDPESCRMVGEIVNVCADESILTDEKRIIFEQIRDHGMTFLIHSQLSRRTEYLCSVLKEFPGIKIQVAHMGRGKPGDTDVIRQSLETFRPYENVTFDTSTTREPEVIEWAVDLVGADRILYASDLPFYMEDPREDIMEGQVRQVLDARITDDQREAIFYKNFYHWIQRGV